jgi:heat shock protein HslJ
LSQEITLSFAQASPSPNFAHMNRSTYSLLLSCFIGVLFLFLNTSCRFITKRRIAKEKEKLSVTDTLHVAEKKSGTDFSASGDVPESWTLQMDLDKNIIFKTSTSGNFLYYPSDITSSIDNQIKTYSSKDYKLIINIEEKPCQSDGISISTTQTTVTCNQISYSGCGIFLKNNALHNKWILEKIDDALVNTTSMRESPFMQLDLLKLKVNGQDGCNRFFGTFNVEGNRIRFNALGATKMACEKPAMINTLFMTNQLVDYYFKEGKLVLYFINDSKLTFKPEF